MSDLVSFGVKIMTGVSFAKCFSTLTPLLALIRLKTEIIEIRMNAVGKTIFKQFLAKFTPGISFNLINSKS
jgi:hypothetical protein